MKILCYINGIMPILEGNDKTTHFNKVSKEISLRLGDPWIKIQMQLDYDYIHDPQSSWRSLLSPFYDMPGAMKGYLVKYPKLNYFYWTLKISDQINFKPSTLDKYLCIEKLPDTKPRKISLFGPYSLYKSINYEGRGCEAKLDIVNYLLMNTLDYLYSQGYELFDFYEPWIIDVNLDLLSDLYRMIGRKYNYVIHTGLIDITKIIAFLVKLKLGIPLVDIFENDLSKIKIQGDVVSLGVIDTRECFIERYYIVKEAIKKLVNISMIDTIMITNNTHLVFLPSHIALDKIKLLVEIKRRLSIEWNN